MSSLSSRTIDPLQRCLLSNGHYRVMLSSNGSGFSRCDDVALTRWREDPTSEPWGSFFLLRDEASGATWSASQQPYGTHFADDKVTLSAAGASITRRHNSIHSVLEVAVSSSANIELRRLTISNHGDRKRQLSVTSYAEIVAGPLGDDNAHPAFSKMFVQTEWDAAQQVLLATRRRRDQGTTPVWIAQTLQREGETTSAEPEYETDRARFLGRDRDLRQAIAMQAGAKLSNSTGCVLDPVFSMRRFLTLGPRESVTLLLWTQLADSREHAMTLTTQLNDAHAAERLFSDASKHAQAQYQQLGIDDAKAQRFAHWMSALLSTDITQRAAPDVLARGHGGAPTLWAAGISGDRPIVLLQLQNADDLTQLRELLLAQTYWRQQHFAVDVVLLNAATGSAGDTLQADIDPLVSAQQTKLKADNDEVKVELFALRDDAINSDLRDGLLTVARVLLGGAQDAPAASAASSANARNNIPARLRASTAAAATSTTSTSLEIANGIGGFCDDGRAYQVNLSDRNATPAPWVNVVANSSFGFVVSATGGGYTWALNSQQNPLTPWPNDPVSDTPHDALYVRDEDSGALWSATAEPMRAEGATYGATHGKGWSRFNTEVHDIALELVQCVPTDDAIKLSRLRISNRANYSRNLSITGYVEWALGANGTTPAPFVVTSRDSKTGALFARNHWRPDFGDRVSFIDMAGQQHSMSGDRHEFLGPLGTAKSPAALHDNTPLSGRVGAGMDPCGALQTRIELPPNTQIDIVFALGDASDEAAAQALVEKYRMADIDAVLKDVAAQWNGLLDTLQVRTPDRSLDIMLNDWLLYQVTACRLWARTAYYQASGAYGYRDQLQDVMALCVSRPDLAREHLLRAAGRQFAEGDVQHWWLPPDGQGIRTRISDDRIWLAYVAAHYVDTSGDAAALDESVPFLDGQSIPDGATDAFFQPSPSKESVSVYEHAARGIDSSLTHGAHGLPLIQTGDWNDGMNSVGEKGRGESSWLGWFLLSTIAAFTPYAEQRGENERVKRWRDYADDLRKALEQAWDGAWYRRGYYDDGTPLGSHESDECKIDTIAQSWSVMAGATDVAHATAAMESVDRMLVDHPNQIARLFTPPFDHAKENPGYIKGYPPGVRENGGQYTHGATWSVFAWAGLGDGDRAGDMFNLLNPISHSSNVAAVERYKVEPYVACADVYSVDPLIGHGGWTWYTGSAAWLYRAGVEALLGFHLQGDNLRVEPCIPKAWPGFEMTYQHHGKQHVSQYAISVKNPDGVCRGVKKIEVDGKTQKPDQAIALVDDGKSHTIAITLGD